MTPQHDRQIVAVIDLGDRAQAGLQRATYHGVIDSDRFEAAADEFGLHSESVQRRHGIRRGELDATLAVEHHDAITDARLSEFAELLGTPEREGSLLDHHREPLEQLAVLAFQATVDSGESGFTFPSEHSDDLAIMTHRHMVDHDAAGPVRIRLTLEHGGVEGLRRNLLRHRTLEAQAIDETALDHGPRRRCDDPAHGITGVRCRPGGGTDVTEHDEGGRVGVDRCVQQQVGKREIAGQGPRPDETLKMRDRSVRQLRVGCGQLGKTRHRSAPLGNQKISRTRSGCCRPDRVRRKRDGPP